MSKVIETLEAEVQRCNRRLNDEIESVTYFLQSEARTAHLGHNLLGRAGEMQAAK